MVIENFEKTFQKLCKVSKKMKHHQTIKKNTKTAHKQHQKGTFPAKVRKSR